MQLHIFRAEEILIPKNRQRKFFDEALIQELAASIADNGIIQPVVVKMTDNGVELVAGERRMRALDICWGFGQEVTCGTRVIPEGCVPCLYLGEIDPIAAFEVELEENIRRTDLDWRERAQATNRLLELRGEQAAVNGNSTPTVADIALEVSGSAEGQFHENVRQDIILARNMDNPVVYKAASRKEAFKALKRDEELKRNEQLGKALGETFNASVHTLLQGDALHLMGTLPSESFDIILTDPPYGISADEYGDSGGRTGGSHRYDDSQEAWHNLAHHLSRQSFRLAKPAAHAYVFCDIEYFLDLRDLMSSAGWTVFRTPLIWVNPSAMRAPWPEHGPQRKWQMILYAMKGKRNVLQLYPDIITCPSDPNLGHQAQKPVGLCRDLLRRSAKPGDSVLDPFCGTGVIYPACHEVKCKATGIELDPAACGIAAQRLKELK